LRLVSDESGELPLVLRLRAVIAPKDEQIASLTAGLETALATLKGEREQRRRLELRVAELERRLSMDSSDSGTPSSKERIGAKEARRGRQESERERRKDRKRGGQPGHQGKGPERDPDPDLTRAAEPPAECRSCRASLDGAVAVEPRWAQVIDVEILRKVTEWLLPGLACGGCGTVTFAAPPPGLHAGAVCYGPVLNAAAVLLSCYGNVPAERSAQLIGMLAGEDVCAGWVDKAVARDIIAILGQEHRAVGDTRARGSTTLDQQVLDDLRERYDTAITSGMIHNRFRDWDTGNHPGHSLATWLRDYKEWTPPPPTKSPHSTPSAPPSRESPGYRRYPPSADSKSRHPVNGHPPSGPQIIYRLFYSQSPTACFAEERIHCFE
jgi:hypothetical protein